jgi:arsenite-transporting ATPase
MMQFLAKPTRVLLFTGKGGVGKTTLACASAVQLADRGQRVLLVSTDPASNLDDVLGEALSNLPAPVHNVPNLSAMNLNPEAAAREYRERMVGPYRGVLPEAAIRSMEEQFSGSCTVEIAAFDEFSRLLSNRQVTDAFDHIVFDTAPTGHTLRLLTLPSAWSGFMQSNTTGMSCLGPLAGLQAQQQLYRQAADALKDAQLTTLLLVARPDRSALLEAARTSHELQQLGVLNQHLIINGMVGQRHNIDPVARAWEDRERQAMTEMPESLQELHCTTVSLAGNSLLGVEALRRIGATPSTDAAIYERTVEHCEGTESLRALVDELAALGRGVIMTMGKGGVGKTTIAAAVAVALAERGCEVLLSTTDPADHLAVTLGRHALPTLSVSRIDPSLETEAYTQEVMQTAGLNSMRTARPCSWRTCGRRARPRSPCFGPLPAPWRKARIESSCLIRRRPGTRSC